MKKEVKIVTILEVQYIKSHGYQVQDVKALTKLFPSEWYVDDYYALKAKILVDAIKNNCLITETDKYKELFMIIHSN